MVAPASPERARQGQRRGLPELLLHRLEDGADEVHDDGREGERDRDLEEPGELAPELIIRERGHAAGDRADERVAPPLDAEGQGQEEEGEREAADLDHRPHLAEVHEALGGRAERVLPTNINGKIKRTNNFRFVAILYLVSTEV